MPTYSRPEKSFGIFYERMKEKGKTDLEIVTNFSVDCHISILQSLNYLENIVGGSEEIENKKEEVKKFYGITWLTY